MSKINNMEKSEEHKKTAIETLEAIVHWMKTSVFDYDEKDLEMLLYDALLDYKKYLKINYDKKNRYKYIK